MSRYPVRRLAGVVLALRRAEYRAELAHMERLRPVYAANAADGELAEAIAALKARHLPAER